MATFTWDHIHLRTPDQEATAQWFERMFGAQITRSTQLGKPRIDMKLGGANIFLAINGELHTPTPDCFLNGITRQTVIGLATSRGIKVIERAIMPDELAKAQEVFLTGSAAEVTPVGEIDGAIGRFRFTPGAICRLMWEDYDRATGKKVDKAAAE